MNEWFALCTCIECVRASMRVGGVEVDRLGEIQLIMDYVYGMGGDFEVSEVRVELGGWVKRVK